MAFDEDLAERVRLLLGTVPAVSERKMFGGLAFMVRQHMTVVVSGKGGIMARVDPETAEGLLEVGPATQAIMRDRAMPGWLRVEAKHLVDDDEVARWVERSVSFNKTLPDK